MITNVDEANERVTVKNTTTIAVDMTNWKLRSVEGDQTYTFPNGFVLKAGATVKVTSGPNANEQRPNTLKWGDQYIWNNSGDPAQLFNGRGEKVSELR